MRIRKIVGLFVVAFSVLVLARPAAAQGSKVDFAAGYQFFRVIDDGGANVPTGWGVSLGAGKDWVKFVADASGHYRDGVQLHMFQAGVEFSGKNGPVVPFARVLSGFGQFSGSGDGTLVWVITPEAGVKIMANDRFGFQTSVGFPVMTDMEEVANGFRLFAGVVIRR
jgi:hypothetical protein